MIEHQPASIGLFETSRRDHYANGSPGVRSWQWKLAVMVGPQKKLSTNTNKGPPLTLIYNLVWPGFGILQPPLACSAIVMAQPAVRVAFWNLLLSLIRRCLMTRNLKSF